MVEGSRPDTDGNPAATPAVDGAAERSSAINPYVAGNPIRGEEMFYGREDVFQFVRQALIGRHQDNIVVLYGQRRTGKTSVLYQMHRHIDPRYMAVLIDLQALSMAGMATFLWEIAMAITRTLRRDYQITLERPKQEDYASNAREQFQGTFLPQVWEAVGDRHLLVMFDESVRLEDQVLAGHLERDIFDYMRHLMQHESRLNFIFSLGDARLEEMQQDYAILFNVAVYKRISFLEADDARRLIVEPAKSAYSYEDEAVRYIVQVGGGHAYYTQLICHSLFTRWQRTGEKTVTAEDVRAALPEVVERATTNLKFVWDQASPFEKFVLVAMAEMMPDQSLPVTQEQIEKVLKGKDADLSAGEIGRALGNLVYTEAITASKGYAFAVDLLRLYLREYQKVEWVREELLKAVEEARAAEALAAPAVAKRAELSRPLAIAAAAVAVVAMAVLLVPSSPLSVFSLWQSTEQIRLAKPPSAPPTPTATAVPPPPGVRTVGRCALTPPDVEIQKVATLVLCVESVEVYEDGKMKFTVSWEARIPRGVLDASGKQLNALQKEPDVGNSNMYVTDAQGGRYDFLDLGEAARELTIIPNGEKGVGWFLFPPPGEGARRFTFHDDDRFWSVSGINLE